MHKITTSIHSLEVLSFHSLNCFSFINQVEERWVQLYDAYLISIVLILENKTYTLTLSKPSCQWNTSYPEKIFIELSVLYVGLCQIELILSAHQEKIPARNAIYACARFVGRWRVATSHPESIYSTTTEQTTDNRLSCVLTNSMWFSVEHYHNTHSTQ
jgi:hypothetical protein